jgi:peptidoglycan/LPS O-acetylase OafA/YrhL
MSTGYIRSLDGVRALAVLLVMTFHYHVNNFGWMGVQLFFVLSGFLITGILWKEKHRDTSLSGKFKKFWARRSLRIFPLYFGLLLFLLLTWLLFNFPPYYPTFIPYLATYTFNFFRTSSDWIVTPLFTHMWSLCVEEQFYLFWPLIIFLCPPKFIKGLMITVMLAAPLIRYALGIYYQQKGLQPEVVADTVYWNTLSHLDAFFIGGSIPVFALGKKVKKPAVYFFCFLFLILTAGAFNYLFGNSSFSYLEDLGYGHGQVAHYEHVWHYTLLNLFFSSFILLMISEHSRDLFPWLQKFLESSWLVRIGKVSYGMYVFHWAILVYFYNKVVEMVHAGSGWSHTLLFIPYVAIVYGFAELSFRFYENKFIQLKDKFFADKPATREELVIQNSDAVSAP